MNSGRLAVQEALGWTDSQVPMVKLVKLGHPVNKDFPDLLGLQAAQVWMEASVLEEKPDRLVCTVPQDSKELLGLLGQSDFQGRTETQEVLERWGQWDLLGPEVKLE